MANKNRDPKRRLTLKELGFLEDPFTRSADPRFLYLSAQHGEVLDRTQEVIEERRGLAVVEGGFGVGKSTVARRLESIYRAIPDDYQIVFVHTASYESEYAALLDVSFALNLTRRKGMTMQWREFETFLVNEAEKGRNVVMILDDAQMIQPEGLNLVHHIYNFDISKKLAQVILFGQPEIQRIFNARPEVLSRVDSWFRLNPLSLEDTFELIRFRCSVAGRKEPLLTQSAFIQVWEMTRGIPREIVNLCSKVIDELGQQGKTTADDEVVRLAIESYQASLAAAVDTPLRQESLFRGA
ncbi:MAG: AAA family ATPase [Anaerolineae bacterium]|nr:AAA family ATPase [Anaerolineae bacterium]